MAATFTGLWFAQISWKEIHFLLLRINTGDVCLKYPKRKCLFVCFVSSVLSCFVSLPFHFIFSSPFHSFHFFMYYWFSLVLPSFLSPFYLNVYLPFTILSLYSLLTCFPFIFFLSLRASLSHFISSFLPLSSRFLRMSLPRSFLRGSKMRQVSLQCRHQGSLGSTGNDHIPSN